MKSFGGESFHTSRWDYDIDLEGKRVGIIGTGATAVQVIPELAKTVGELYVFQRTLSTIHDRGFPNLFVVTGPQGGGAAFNFTETIVAHSDYIVWLLSTIRDKGVDVVDVKEEYEDAYATHCREVDMASAPLRDCLSYYNGHGGAEPGSLAYYGGGNWHKFRKAAQETLDPYEFETR